MKKKDKGHQYNDDQLKTILHGLIDNYGLNVSMMPENRKHRRTISKWILFPLYSIGFPGFTACMLITQHYIWMSIGIILTLYGVGKMVAGDRFVFWLLKPVLKWIFK